MEQLKQVVCGQEGTQNSINLNINPEHHLNLYFVHTVLKYKSNSSRWLLSTFIVFMAICNIICEIIKSESGISYILYKKYEVTEAQFLSLVFIMFNFLNQFLEGTGGRNPNPNFNVIPI